MDPGGIPKDLLYGEIEEGTKPVGCPYLRFRDVCWKLGVYCRCQAARWLAVMEGIQMAENTRMVEQTANLDRKKERPGSGHPLCPFYVACVEETVTPE